MIFCYNFNCKKSTYRGVNKLLYPMLWVYWKYTHINRRIIVNYNNYNLRLVRFKWNLINQSVRVNWTKFMNVVMHIPYVHLRNNVHNLFLSRSPQQSLTHFECWFLAFVFFSRQYICIISSFICSIHTSSCSVSVSVSKTIEIAFICTVIAGHNFPNPSMKCHRKC